MTFGVSTSDYLSTTFGGSRHKKWSDVSLTFIHPVINLINAQGL